MLTSPRWPVSAQRLGTRLGAGRGGLCPWPVEGDVEGAQGHPPCGSQLASLGCRTAPHGTAGASPAVGVSRCCGPRAGRWQRAVGLLGQRAQHSPCRPWSVPSCLCPCLSVSPFKEASFQKRSVEQLDTARGSFGGEGSAPGQRPADLRALAQQGRPQGTSPWVPVPGLRDRTELWGWGRTGGRPGRGRMATVGFGVLAGSPRGPGVTR